MAFTVDDAKNRKLVAIKNYRFTFLSAFRTSELAVKGLWNLVCRMVEAGPFIERCLQMGMIESLCAATKGAAELLLETDEV